MSKIFFPLYAVLFVLALLTCAVETGVTSKHRGTIAYHFYEGGLTAIGLKGQVATLLAPPEVYGLEIDGHGVETSQKTWYACMDGQKIEYTERKNFFGVRYFTDKPNTNAKGNSN